MIELINAYKVFKTKSETKVAINRTSIKFDKGLTTLLGPSGSGKTTLLNVIGGLDKLSSGTLLIDNIKYNKSIDSKLYTDLRREKIGFVFQHYYLFNSLTIYENLKESLNLIGIFDDSEIDKRITEALTLVDMYRYRNRKVSTLSGGQQQRISIARALIKNPDILLADEPTGNLDSENTFQIMCILKSIAKEKTVILVTHEAEIAKFFSDRIVEISNGQVVKDYVNEDTSATYDLESNDSIYLQDLTKQTFGNKNFNINIYHDGSLDSKQLDLMFLKHHDGLLTNVDSNSSYELINGNSDVQFLDEKYNPVTKEDIETYETKLSYDDSSKKNIFYPFKVFKNTKIKYNHAVLAKFATFVVLGLYGVFAYVLLMSIATDDVNFINDVTDPADSYGFSYEETQRLLEDKEVANSIDTLCTRTRWDASCSYAVYPTSEIKSSDLTAGRMPENKNEYVVTTGIASRYYEAQLYELLGKSLSEDTFSTISNYYMPTGQDHIVVGVIKDSNPYIYGDFDSLLEVINYSRYIYYQDLLPGNMISSTTVEDNSNFSNFTKNISELENNEILINSNLSYLYNIDDEIDLCNSYYSCEDYDYYYSITLKVVGYYDNAENHNYMIANKSTMLDVTLGVKSSGYRGDSIYIVSTDSSFNLDEYINENYFTYKTLRELYEDFRTYYHGEDGIDLVTFYTVFAAIILTIIFTFRIGNISYDLAVYKSLGVKRLHLIMRYTLKAAMLPLLLFVVFSVTYLYLGTYINNLEYMGGITVDLSFINVFKFLFIQIVFILTVTGLPAIVKTNKSISKLYQDKN